MAGELMAAGSMFGPYGAAAGAGLDALKSLSGGAAAPSSALSSQSNGYAFDNSGFVVNTGPGMAGSALPSWALPALAALGLVVWLKSRKN